MRARFPLGVALFELKQSAEARREFEAVRREVGEHPNVSYYLGRLDLLDQNFAGAVRNLQQGHRQAAFPGYGLLSGFGVLQAGRTCRPPRSG
jgi:hypothetical protein